MLPTSLLLLVSSPVVSPSAEAVDALSATGEGAAQVAAADRPPGRLALLVGIDRYAGEGDHVPELRGAVADVERAAQVLHSRFDFRDEDVLLLRNETATHEAIVRAFSEHLLDRVGPDTEVVFWFSGHGSRVPDTGGTETDGLDSTLLAHDSRAAGEAGEYDLVDDELGSLLAALVERTPRTLVVLDTCHSGGATRGNATASARFAPPGARPLDPSRLESFWPKGIELREDEALTAVDPARFACLAACGPEQAAFEIDLSSDADARFHGLFSHFLLEELENCPPGTTLAAVAERVAVRVLELRVEQCIWTAGALDRVLFGGSFAPPPRGYRARVAVRGELRVEAGHLHGLRPGSELRVLGPEGDDRGRAIVRSVGPVLARARVEGEERFDVDEALRVEEVARPGADRLPVATTDEAFIELLAECEACEVISTDAGAVDDGSYQLRGHAEGRLSLFDPEGLLLWTSERSVANDRAAVAERLCDAIRGELAWRELFALPLAASDLPIRLSVSTRPEGGEGAVPAARPAAARPRNSTELPLALPPYSGGGFAGEVEAVVTNTGTRPIYVHLLDVSEDRSVVVVLGDVERVRLDPGQSRRKTVQLLRPEAWTLARPQRDRLMAIATLRYADFRPLQRRTLLRGADDLPTAIRRALAAGRTRGTTFDTSSARWGLDHVDVLLEGAPE